MKPWDDEGSDPRIGNADRSSRASQYALDEGSELTRTLPHANTVDNQSAFFSKRTIFFMCSNPSISVDSRGFSNSRCSSPSRDEHVRIQGRTIGAAHPRAFTIGKLRRRPCFAPIETINTSRRPRPLPWATSPLKPKEETTSVYLSTELCMHRCSISKGCLPVTWKQDACTKAKTRPLAPFV
ncbi:hypothetical protein MUK42_13481 [Musa troglodytarum]|uniref:Uncharacterized protein n=1 Tax=Musa troglodytarum TaxID=320322 RepID=A0A9E7H9U4_9LILI|nr:hypothetical protein MUK42_13481 [Musa troglodytarum]